MKKNHVAGLYVLCLATMAALSVPCQAARLDEMSLDRWKKLREVERYQLQIAEKYYREKNYKVALSEYEKFLTLYEDSEGAPYSQLKWSLCQVQLRKLNTAIKEGFQSVIDYWPESPEAVASAYFIGRAYKDIGEVRKARKAYQIVLDDHGKHLAAVFAAVDMIDLTRIRATDQKSIDERVKLWRWLTFEAKRTRDSNGSCATASQQLAVHEFEFGSFNDAVKALQTTYDEKSIGYYVSYYARGPVGRLVGDEKQRSKGEKLADQGVAWIRQQIPADRSTEEEKKFAREQWYHMADLQASSRRKPKVIELYEDVLKQFGSNDVTLGRFANWYKGVGDYDKARQLYQRFENKIEGTNQVAVSYRQQGKYDPAVQAYQRNVAADTENPAKWQAEIAQTYREARKYLEAIAVYEELYKVDAERAEDWRWMVATCYRESGKYKEAIGHYRQCNNFPSNYEQMASCHRALKQYGEAIILYNQIVGGARNRAPWATLQIGYTYEDSNRKEAAIKAFQLVCKNFPTDSHASRAHAHLQTKYKITVTLGGAKDK